MNGGFARRDRAGGHANRGSALILVLVCLVMMVLLGTAYIQIARVDRKATRQLTAVSNLDTVRDAIIAYMKAVIKDDIMDYQGNYFVPGSSKDPGAASNPAPVLPREGETGYDETWDYPFTNNTVSYQLKSYRTATAGQTLGVQAAGGLLDDSWLANTYMSPELPTANANTASWNQISNLRGMFLRLPKGGSTQTEPEERVVFNVRPTDAQNLYTTNPLNHNGWGETFQDLTATANNGDNVFRAVYSFGSMTAAGTSNANSLDYNANASWDRAGTDTDGDGIVDAAWTWAPDEVRQIGSMSYVVAYRIIDLSAMVNLNVATAVTSNGTALPTLDLAARGAFPTDLDLSRLLAKSTIAAPQWVNELKNVMAYRGLASPAAFPFPPGTATLTSTFAQFPTANSRGYAWVDAVNGARVYGRLVGRFSDSDEVELRSRGGLNTSVVAPIEDAMPIALRRAADPAVELTYKDVVGVTFGGTSQDTAHYMQGARAGLNGPSAIALNAATRNIPALRHMLTTSSGANIYANPYPGMNPTADRLQCDLVYQLATNSKARAETLIAPRLAKIFKIGSPMYLGLTNTADIDQIAYEFAANIVDYSDVDNTPTQVSIGGKTLYGLEVMPFLREFYVQAGYESDMPDTTSTPVFKKWKYKAGSAAFVVEVGNPFDKPVKFAGGTGNGVELRLRIIREGGASVLDYDIPTNTPELPARNGTPGAHLMAFHSDPATPINENGKGANLMADLGVTTIPAAQRRAVTVKLPDGAIDNSQLTVELQFKNASGSWVTYDRLRHANMKLPVEYTADNGDGVTKLQAHGQIGLARDGQRNRYLSNKGKSVAKDDPAQNSYLASVAKIGNDNKGISGDTDLDKVQFAHANHQIFNVAELGYIFMVGIHDDGSTALGDLPTRISGKDGDETRTSVGNDTTKASCAGRQFLSFTRDGTNTPASYVVPTTTKLPHFCMVMDQFTTLSPANDVSHADGTTPIDNNLLDAYGANALGPNGVPREAFVPGRLNVNTTPAWLLAMTSPMPETHADLSAFYLAVTEYRDRPFSRAQITGITGLPSDQYADKGIRSIGELMLIANRILPYTADVTQRSQRYGMDGAALGAGDPKRNYPHYDDTAVLDPVVAAMAGDPEFVEYERMTRFQYLTNTLTTRSDRFCAYVSLRGYPTGAFNQAPSETLRFFVLLDRSNLTNSDGEVTHFPKTGQKN